MVTEGEVIGNCVNHWPSKSTEPIGLSEFRGYFLACKMTNLPLDATVVQLLKIRFILT